MDSLNKQQQWQDLGHEMKHYFFDKGIRLYLRKQLVDYFETMANYFAYHFLYPHLCLCV
ncbi:ImmA/IrrE family metallo-endopeptidase [Pseudogracilibacillus auburnensis]|uniref:ImmA/IrrE family metallo-endopeptidase n=1 Tax=Pseudogracilibacillus auburnensis TaxID=1494959 RepID=UPI003558304E